MEGYLYERVMTKQKEADWEGPQTEYEYAASAPALIKASLLLLIDTQKQQHGNNQSFFAV